MNPLQRASEAVQRVLRYLALLPADKALHVAYGAALALLGALAALAIGQPLWLGALALAVLFAVLKEVYDKASGKGTPDVWDAVATVAGAVPTVAVGVIAEYLK